MGHGAIDTRGVPLSVSEDDVDGVRFLIAAQSQHLRCIRMGCLPRRPYAYVDHSSYQPFELRLRTHAVPIVSSSFHTSQHVFVLAR
jgi:hypothetical protein